MTGVGGTREVDWLIDGPGAQLHPFEFKLSATPRAEMADRIRPFRRQFAAMTLGIGVDCAIHLLRGCRQGAD